MTKETQILPDVITFLLGAGPLDGVHFGEVPEGKPPYWWRRALRELFEARTPAIADGVGVEELFQRFMNVLENETDIPNLYAVNAARLLAQHVISTPPQAATDEG